MPKYLNVFMKVVVNYILCLSMSYTELYIHKKPWLQGQYSKSHTCGIILLGNNTLQIIKIYFYTVYIPSTVYHGFITVFTNLLQCTFPQHS